MLNLKLKTFHLVLSRIGHEQSKINVEEYDKISLFFMFWKWYYHSHPLVEFERSVVDQKVEGDINLEYLWNDSQHKWTNSIIDQ